MSRELTKKRTAIVQWLLSIFGYSVYLLVVLAFKYFLGWYSEGALVFYGGFFIFGIVYSTIRMYKSIKS